MFFKKDVLFVKEIDLTMAEGKYIEKYWGKAVYDELPDTLYIFSPDGSIYTAICYSVDLDGKKYFSPKEMFIDEVDELPVGAEISSIAIPLDTDRLLKLKQKFSLDEILTLRQKGSA